MQDAGLASPVAREAALAPVAAAIGEPARAAMLAQLMDGRSLPASELARRAGVAPATASSHLTRLVAAGLVRVHLQGRHRYHELASPLVAQALEALSLISPVLPVRSLRQGIAAETMREARSCYDHLAGRLGVAVRDGLLESGCLVAIDERDHAVTEMGCRRLRSLEIDPNALAAQRRVFARSCLDWSERRPDLAGALPAAVYRAMLRAGWLLRRPGDRGLQVTAACGQGLRAWLDLPPPWPNVDGDVPRWRS